MRIYELLDTHPPARRYGERSDGMRIQQKLCPLGAPSLQERAGVRLLELLQPTASVPEVAVAVVDADATTADRQAVRALSVPRGSTRRPIVAEDANAAQITRVVVTQEGQVEEVACIGSLRNPSTDTTDGFVVVLVRCAQVD